jgi:2-polyprenyl-3-methyl-5-hydroxy-6-metoxy-1,4-benzoquinol methylase
MEKAEYAKMHALEETYWWFVAKRRILSAVSKPYLKKRTELLDVGCGTGVVLQHFKSQGISVTGIDFSKEALKFCRKRGLTSLKQVNLEKKLPKMQQFDIIIAADVIEHLNDDLGALKRIKGLLKKDGVLIVSVPAYQWMWSSHDVALHHKRRYTAKRLRIAMTKAGYKIERLTYTNMFTFFPAAAVRLFKKAVGSEGSTDTAGSSKAANRLLLAVYRVELGLMKIMPLPFGLSVLCVAKK